MLFPPSKTNHIAVNHVHIAYYPPIISLFIFMIGYLVDVYNKCNYLDFGIGMTIFPFILGSFVVWLHLVLDVILCIINRYGKDSLLDLRGNENNLPTSDYSPIPKITKDKVERSKDTSSNNSVKDINNNVPTTSQSSIL
jgi:hypothetical protein